MDRIDWDLSETVSVSTSSKSPCPDLLRRFSTMTTESLVWLPSDQARSLLLACWEEGRAYVSEVLKSNPGAEEAFSFALRRAGVDPSALPNVFLGIVPLQDRDAVLRLDHLLVRAAAPVGKPMTPKDIKDFLSTRPILIGRSSGLHVVGVNTELVNKISTPFIALESVMEWVIAEAVVASFPALERVCLTPALKKELLQVYLEPFAGLACLDWRQELRVRNGLSEDLEISREVDGTVCFLGSAPSDNDRFFFFPVSLLELETTFSEDGLPEGIELAFYNDGACTPEFFLWIIREYCPDTWKRFSDVIDALRSDTSESTFSHAFPTLSEAFFQALREEFPRGAQLDALKKRADLFSHLEKPKRANAVLETFLEEEIPEDDE